MNSLLVYYKDSVVTVLAVQFQRVDVLTPQHL
jgi:hypothetical protein